MIAEFYIRAQERNDPRAIALARVGLLRNGLKIDPTRRVTCRRHHGFWHYVIPVREEVAA